MQTLPRRPKAAGAPQTSRQSASGARPACRAWAPASRLQGPRGSPPPWPFQESYSWPERPWGSPDRGGTFGARARAARTTLCPPRTPAPPGAEGTTRPATGRVPPTVRVTAPPMAAPLSGRRPRGAVWAPARDEPRVNLSETCDASFAGRPSGLLAARLPETDVGVTVTIHGAAMGTREPCPAARRSQLL